MVCSREWEKRTRGHSGLDANWKFAGWLWMGDEATRFAGYGGPMLAALRPRELYWALVVSSPAFQRASLAAQTRKN